jgi:hypothetical protein
MNDKTRVVVVAAVLVVGLLIALALPAGTCSKWSLVGETGIPPAIGVPLISN